MSNVQFSSFVKECLTKGAGSVETTDLYQAYMTFSGAKSGRNNLYKYMESIEGVTRVKSLFSGIMIKPSEIIKNKETAENTTKETIVKNTAEKKEEKTMTAYEEAMLELAKHKVELKARIAKEAAEENARIAKEAAKENARIAKEAAEENARIAKEAAEENARIAELKDRTDKEIAESNARIAELKARTDKEIAELKARTAKETAELKARIAEESAKEIAELKTRTDKEIAQMYIDDKENDRRLIREENNKNRQMYLTTKFNKYLDLKVYGSPAKQYITEESLIDVVGYDNYAMTSKINIKEIQEDVKKVSEDVIIYEAGIAKDVKAIEVQKIPKLIEEISSENLKQRIGKIPEIATQDENRHIISQYEEKKCLMKEKTSPCPAMSKDKYLRPENDIKTINNEIQIKCACCSEYVALNDGACHRGHNIPKSDGGDWSKENIYLICANCNLSMSDSLSIDEFKVKLYAEKLDKYMISEKLDILKMI